MSISFTCECGKKLKVAEALAGKKVKCPDCKKVTVASDNGAVKASHKAAAPALAAKKKTKPPTDDEPDLSDLFSDNGGEEAVSATAKTKSKSAGDKAALTDEEEQSPKPAKKKPAKPVDEEPIEAAKAKKVKKLAAADDGEKPAGKSRTKMLIVVAALILLLGGGGGGAAWYFYSDSAANPTPGSPAKDTGKGSGKDNAPVSPAALSTEAKFDTFESEAGRFTIKFWGKPQPLKDTKKKGTYYAVNTNLPQLIYRISFYDLPFVPDAAARQMLFAELPSDLANVKINQQDIASADIDIGQNRFPGKYMEITLGPLTCRVQRYLVNQRVYEMYVRGAKNDVSTGSADEFLRSFTLQPEPDKKKRHR